MPTGGSNRFHGRSGGRDPCLSVPGAVKPLRRTYAWPGRTGFSHNRLLCIRTLALLTRSQGAKRGAKSAGFAPGKVTEAVAARGNASCAITVSLDCDDVGAPTPPQVRCCNVFSAVLPGADEVLELGNRPRLFQVLNCGIEPA